MNVLFKNIPIGTRNQELVEFIKFNFTLGSADSKDLSLSSNGISMMEIQDNFTHPIEQFGIVRISSSEVAKEVIRQLNGFIFNKNKITVRKYHTRSASNDPRINNKAPKGVIDQRIKDRRETILVYSRRV
ncbi:MAG: hypothetical protein KAH20_16370 [Methylococcales bacterium]|nr:hypothetical protein [Methylococcales bacterium]